MLIPLLYGLLLAVNLRYLNTHSGQDLSQGTNKEVVISLDDDQIGVPYTELYTGTQANPETVLYLQISRDMAYAIPEQIQFLSREFRIIIPDYMELVKQVTLDNYSFHELSRISNKLSEALHLQQLHIVGYQYGALVGLHLSNESNADIQSFSMLSSAGVQELEFLGGYHLNHGIYTVHLLGLELLKYGVPHFGLFDLDDEIAFLKIMNYSDQRVARKLFQNLELPVLIQHCENDQNISHNLALEHNRIIPHSKLLSYNCEELENADSATNDLADFIRQADEQSLVISNLDVARSLLPFKGKKSYRVEGGALLLVMLLIILSSFMSEDLACIGAGLMVARGLIGFGPALLACLMGLFIGDILVYVLGRWLGSSVVHKAPVKWLINEQDLERSNHWFRTKGPVIIIISRFIPGSRFPTYLSAGILKTGFLKFILYFGVATILWTPVLIGAAVLAGQELLYYFSLYQDYAIWVLIAVVFLLLIVFKYLMPLLTSRGRRVLWRKIRQFNNR